MAIKMRKNDQIEINVTGSTGQGAGVGRYDGMAVFINGAVCGETVRVKIIKVSKNYAIGRLTEIITPSPDRIDSDCGSFPSCGGCAWRHINYSAELKIKEQSVKDAFARIGGMDIELSPIVGGVLPDRYRNKAQYPVAQSADGSVVCGFYAARSHRLVPSEGCMLQPGSFGEICNAVTQFVQKKGISVYDESTGRGVLRHIYIRYAKASDKYMVCAVINADRLPFEREFAEMLCSLLGGRLGTVVVNINRKKTNVILSDKCRVIYGDGYITDEICGIKVRLNALSFYQVNRDMAELLYKKAAEFAQPENKVIFDLYCGAGTIGLSMAGRAKKIIGAEIVPQAVEDAKFNARQNNIRNAEFICADAKQAAHELSERGISADVVIVDPPRKGLESGLPEFIAHEISPERVVYVSCDPATLARDCAAFDRAGYSVVSAVPFDLFPRTAHVETVALLARKSQ